MLQYTDKASRAEMRFAGLGLNLAGGLLLLIGLVNWFNLRGVVQSGWLPCLGGLALGLTLLFLGDRCYKGSLPAYAQPLLATGSIVLLFTACAAHYLFHLLPTAGLVVSVMLLVAWGGLAVFRYQCTFLGHGMLAALFLAPFFLRLPGGTLVAYLVSIHLGTTLLAWYRRYPTYLVVGFLGSYGLFFAQFQLSQPVLTLAFLASTYALFLLSSYLFQFVRDEQDELGMLLGLVQPTAFALLSYLVLFLLPNAVAVSLYATLFAVHLALTLAAQARGYALLQRINLILTLLFANAAISFVPYFASDTSFFALTSVLWLAEAFLLLALARRFQAAILSRFSYLALFLVAVQLCYVLPEMPQTSAAEVLHQMLLSLVCVGALTAYGVSILNRPQELPGADLMARAALATAVLRTGAMVLHDGTPSLALLAAASLALLLAVLGLRLERVREEMRSLVILLALVVAAAACLLPVAWWARLGIAAVLTTSAAVLRRERESCLEPLALVVLAPLSLVWGIGPALVLSAAVALSLTLWPRASFEPFRKKAIDLLAGVTAWFALLAVPLSESPVLWALALLWAAMPEGARWIVPLAIGLKASFALGSGAGVTLLWCLAGGLLLSREPRAARTLLFLACLKSILVDGTLGFGPYGPYLLPTHSLGWLDLAGFVGVTSSYFLLARRLQPGEPRNELLVMGLTAFSFGSAGFLHSALGVLIEFQVILSAFWCASAFLFILIGVHRELKVFRLFGLTILAAATLKILCVDAGVLSAYSQVTTLMILGALLMCVSFIYQLNRSRLTESPELVANPSA